MKRFAISIALFFGTISAGYSQDVQPVNEFSGLNTDANTLTLQNGQTPDSQNVVTDRGTGVQGRKGLLQFSTQPATDIWQFPLSSGIRYIIKRSSNTLLADTGGGTFATVVSTIPSDRQTFCSPLGDRFYFMNTTDGLKYWTGTSVVVASGTLNGTMLGTWKGRLVEAGKSGEERVIRLSKYLDGTSWTAPTNPSDDDAAIITVSGALDENVRALYASFQDKLIWFKKSSFGGIYGSRRSNFSNRTFSDFIGTSAPETIQDCDGFLRWLGNNRKIYEFDGSTFHIISDENNNLFSVIAQGDTANRTSVLTSQSDWERGSSTPSGNLSTTITPGSIVMSTMAATSQTDTSESDFELGTLTTLDSTTDAGSLRLSLGSESIINQQYGSHDNDVLCGGSCSFTGQSFTASSSFLLTSIIMSLEKGAGGAGDSTIYFYVYSDNSNSPGSQLAAGSIDSSVLTTSYQDITVSFPGLVRIASGTRYWILKANTSVCSGGAPVTGTLWAGTNGSFSESSRRFACTNDTSFSLKYKVQGKVYNSSGNIISRSFDVGFTTNTWLWTWGALTGTFSSLPTNSTVTFQTQSSADGSSFDSLVTVPINATSTSTVRRYIRYKASFSTTDTTATPILSDVTMNAGPFIKSSGTYTSPAVNVGSNISAWGPITIGDSQSSGNSTILYQIQSSTISNSAQFSSTGWTSITNNSIPTVSTNPYVAFRATFTVISTGTQANPALNDFQFAWTEGSTIRPASGWIDQRYWLSVATTSLTNNLIYVYDRSHQWQRYYGINADCIGAYGSGFYVGSSSGIYKTEEGYSDAGNSINAFYISKDFAPSGPDINSQFLYTWVTTDNSDSTITPSYRLDGSTTSIAMGTYQMNSGSKSIQNFKIPFSVSDDTAGKFINLRWGISGTSFWRIINGNIYYNKGFLPQ